ncbi:MAG: cytochrome c3 family protein [Candidatus Wallbacteria bacterium]|nr:cytochrome c3 family protein [Candidatus Wallbacteria bacterium]
MLPSIRRPRRPLATLLAVLAAGGMSLLFAVSREEMERYGFGSEVAGSAAAAGRKPAALPARRIPPPPILPKKVSLPAGLIPAPTRPRARIVLTPSGKPGALPPEPAAVERSQPVLDEALQKVFPDQLRSRYAGDDSCVFCHSEKGENQPHTLYGLIKNNKSVPLERRGCEGCHGPGSEHVDSMGAIANPVKLPHLAVSRLCLSCHEDQRRVRRLEWHVTGHQEAFISCTTCHSAHKPKNPPSLRDEPDRLCFKCHQDQWAKFQMRSHHPLKREGSNALSSQREGKIHCIDCHQPYSARNGADLLRRDGKELCVRCHAETRGPFLFEHDSVSGDLTHQCTTCHAPHGSPNRDLLIVPGRGLCLRCHTDRVAHRPGPTCYNAQCHRDIHGSNLDQLFIPR